MFTFACVCCQHVRRCGSRTGKRHCCWELGHCSRKSCSFGSVHPAAVARVVFVRLSEGAALNRQRLSASLKLCVSLPAQGTAGVYHSLPDCYRVACYTSRQHVVKRQRHHRHACIWRLRCFSRLVLCARPPPARPRAAHSGVSVDSFHATGVESDTPPWFVRPGSLGAGSCSQHVCGPRLCV